MQDDDDSDDRDVEQGNGRRRKNGVRGCGMAMFLLGGVAIASGIYLMGRWDALPGIGRAGAVVLTVLGTLLVLPILLALTFKLVMRLLLGRLTKGMRGAVQSMVTMNEGLYSQVHEFRAATADDFESTDRGRYDAATQELSAVGFRHLGDVVDETISGMGLPSPVIRVLAAPDGGASAGLYHLPDMADGYDDEDDEEEGDEDGGDGGKGRERSAGGGGGGQPITCDLESEFTDGTFLATNNTAGRDLTTPAPPVERRQHPPETPLADLVRLHQQEVQKLLAAKPGASAVPLHTLADVMEMQKRLQAAKHAFRKRIGYLDPAEVRRVAEQTEGTEDLAGPIADTVEQVKREQRHRDGGA